MIIKSKLESVLLYRTLLQPGIMLGIATDFFFFEDLIIMTANALRNSPLPLEIAAQNGRGRLIGKV